MDYVNISGSYSFFDGGAIYIDDFWSLRINYSSFKNVSSEKSSGGSIFMKRGELLISNTTFIDSSAFEGHFFTLVGTNEKYFVVQINNS